jgi:hypothetical protein
MEPPVYFVRDKTSLAVRHWDYLRDRRATALCGYEYSDEIQWEGTVRPAKVCRNCQEVLPRFEARWWRKAARREHAHHERLEASNKRLEGDQTQLRRQIAQLTYQLELSRDAIESQKAKIGSQSNAIEAGQVTIRSQKDQIDTQTQKIENQRKTLRGLQSAGTPSKAAPPTSSVNRSPNR